MRTQSEQARTREPGMIAVDCRMLASSGIGTYLRNILSRLAVSGEFPLALLGHAEELGRQPWASASGVRVVDVRTPIYSVAEQLRLPLALPRGTRLLWSPHYAAPLLAPVPLVVTIHDICHLAMPEFFPGAARRAYSRTMFRLLRHRARTVLTVSGFTRDELVLRLGYDPDRIRVVPNGVDAWWFEPGGGERPHPAPYFLAVGNLKAHKNLERLVRAFAKAGRNLPHDLVLVGRIEGMRSRIDIRELLDVEGTHGRVHLAGEVDDPLLKGYLEHAEALVFPSLYEGFGLPPLEAMACGCPVAASNIPSVREVCGDDVVSFDPASVDSMAAALEQVAAGGIPDRERARKRALGYDWDRAAEQTARVLGEALSGT